MTKKQRRAKNVNPATSKIDETEKCTKRDTGAGILECGPSPFAPVDAVGQCPKSSGCLSLQTKHLLAQYRNKIGDKMRVAAALEELKGPIP